MRVKTRGGRSCIADLRLAGASKLLFPRVHDADGLTAVVLNTSGGVTGGDRFRLRLALDAKARACITTQAAERLYKAQPGETGLIANRISIASGAALHWLPQETIVFDGAAAHRSLQVDMAEDAEFLAVEPLVFGRTAMGESVAQARFRDRWTLRRAGQLVYADRLTLEGRVSDTLAHTADGARAMASLVLVSPRAEQMLAPLRAHLPETGGASLLAPGVLFARLLASDAFALRRALVPALETLTGAALPRTWMI
ncbi:urease accessory protein UreD [Roseobacteraceae bacterium S113]